jgi:uncharacterized protein (TIGR00730 family)
LDRRFGGAFTIDRGAVFTPQLAWRFLNLMKRICVHCGSSLGVAPVYREASKSLATLIAKRSIELVYGGASVGLMGVVADTAVAAGAHVIGIMPERLFPKEIEHTGLGTFHAVPSLYERKKMLVAISDAFVSLPGGIGTIDEFLDVLLGYQLGIHQKPCGLLNVNGFFDPFIQFLHQMVSQGFIRQQDIDCLFVETDGAILLDKLADFIAIRADTKDG